MKTTRRSVLRVELLLFLLFSGTATILAQNPTYKCELRNDIQLNANTFEFDVYLLRTGTVPFQLATIEYGIIINRNAINGGTLTATVVSGSSELNTAQAPTNTSLSYNSGKNKTCIEMNAKLSPGNGNGSIISNLGYGTRVGRIRVVNRKAFAAFPTNPKWNWDRNMGQTTKITAYVEGKKQTISANASHTINNLNNFTLNKSITNYSVTGTGAYCAGSMGVSVGLSNSDVGIMYRLYKNGTAVSPIVEVAGTGAAISFGNQLVGAYTVYGGYAYGSYFWGACQMTSNAVIAENQPLTAGVSIAENANNVCAGSLVTFTATPTNGGTAPQFQWKVNGTIAGDNSGTFSYYPNNGDKVSVSMASNETCASGNPAKSNTIKMVVIPLVDANVTIYASANPVGAGIAVTLTADINGGGIAPTHKWFKNNLEVGDGVETYSYIPNNDDEIHVEVCPDPSSFCNTVKTINSNSIKMSVSMETQVNAINDMDIRVFTMDNNIYVDCYKKAKQIYVTTTMGAIIWVERNVTGLKKIDLGNFPNACYVIKIVTDDHVYTEKLLLK